MSFVIGGRVVWETFCTQAQREALPWISSLELDRAARLWSLTLERDLELDPRVHPWSSSLELIRGARPRRSTLELTPGAQAWSSSLGLDLELKGQLQD